MNLPAIQKAVAPPPTSAEAFHAMAEALSEKRKKLNEERRERIDAALEERREHVIKVGRAEMAKAKLEARMWCGEWQVTKMATLKTVPGIERFDTAVEEASNMPHLETNVREIVKELREAASEKVRDYRQSRVAAILNSPAVRKKLLAEAERLLATPTSADKAQAIEVEGGAR